MIQPEFLYSSMGAKTESSVNGDHIYRLNYFSIPLFANYHFSKKWNAVLGPQFDILIIGKEITGSEESEVTADYKDNSINITGGTEFWPLEKIGLNVHYIHGLTNISKSNASIKNQAFQFTIAIRL